VRRWLISAIIVLVVLGGVLFVRGDVPCELLVTQPACEVALLPGPAEDTLGKIEVADADVYPPDGELLLTTVAVQDDLSLSAWLDARRSRIVDAVPRDSVFPPGSDRHDVAEQNAALMADSQLVATIAALRALGHDFDGEGALVSSVVDDAVTDELVDGDVIVAVDGVEVAESRDVVEAVRRASPGDRVTLQVRDADGDERETVVTLGRSPEDPDRAYIGVLLTTDLDLPVDVTIDAGVIGGPSAGLMFALSIIELLGPEDLTGGHVIAGTGTVDTDGAIGAVGGVRQKVVGAATAREDDEPASVFLVPRGNLPDARSAVVANDLLLVPIDTLDEALDAMDALRAGEQPADALTLAADG
jgi:Lon-like protease